jgi:predicted alpha/beta-fold hydrolase
MKLIFQDEEFSFQLLRAIGYSYYGGADIGECLSTAYRIKEGDFESWYKEWLNTANRVKSYADNSLSKGHKISARDAYLRCSNYYRTAEFFLHINPEDKRIIPTWNNSRECFVKSMSLSSDLNFQSIEIPYQNNITLPGYFYKANTNNNYSSSTEPTLILFTGFDGTQEELYTTSVISALQRGYNCLTFEGPGQGRVIREQHIPFRQDWEKVVTPVVDYAINNLKGVDPNQLALMGISMGGYLAARAVAFEHRIAACILNDGIFDLYETFKTYLSDVLIQAINNNNQELVNTVIEIFMNFSTRAKWGISHGMWTFGVKTPFEYIKSYTNYSLKDIIQYIKCPTLVLEAEDDQFFKGQPKQVYDNLKCTKDYILFKNSEGAGDHCQIAALSLSNQRIFDWLDKIIIR